MAAECARADIRDERRVWTAQRQPLMRQQPHRLVFLDETFVNTKMARLRGRSPKGQRLRARAPFGHWGTHTFIAGLRPRSSALHAHQNATTGAARFGGQPGGRGRGREPLSMATKVKTASVTLICASPSRDRRQASTWNFIDVRPVETRSA